jgi:hypothetical protein
MGWPLNENISFQLTYKTMNKKNLAFLVFAVLFQLSITLVSAHSPKNPASVEGNLYLHTNLAGYHPGESILFKAYLTQENLIQPVDSLYTVLLDKDGNEVAVNTIPVKNDQAYGKIDIPSSSQEGYYVLIASAGSPKNAVASGMFSRIIEVRGYAEPDFSVVLKLTDTLYKPGSALTSNVMLTGIGGKPVQTSFSWELTGNTGRISEGKGRTEANGKGSLTVALPDFKKEDILRLTITASFKGPKKIISIVIPTPYNTALYQEGKSDIVNDRLNISIKTLKKQYLLNENVDAEILVTDGDGNHVAADLSVSCSNLTREFSPLSNLDFQSFSTMGSKLLALPANMESNKAQGEKSGGKGKSSSGSVFSESVRQSFSNYLLLATQEPGRPFDVSTNKSSKGKKAPKKEGYSPDLSVLDIILQIKPYWIANNKIIFSSSGVTSVNFQDGALIVIDGVMMGTDISVLNSLSVTDIALITASTSPMDIMKYTALNSTGIIEIYLKKGPPEAEKDPEEGRLSDSLLWQTDLSTDVTGKTKISFLGNKSTGVVITVAGIASGGMIGTKTLYIAFN